MILILIILCIIGTPLFSVIAASAMFGYASQEIDLMAIVIEIIGISDMPFLGMKTPRLCSKC